MRHIIKRALAFERFERAIEDRQMFWFQSRGDCRSIRIGHILNRVERVDVRDDPIDLLRIVIEFFQGRFDGLVDNFQHPAAGEQFVFHQRNVRFDPGRVAIHQKTDRPRRRQYRHLSVAITVTFTQFSRAFPSLARFLF